MGQCEFRKRLIISSTVERTDAVAARACFYGFLSGTVGQLTRLGATNLFSAAAVRAEIAGFRAFEFSRDDRLHAALFFAMRMTLTGCHRQDGARV